MLQLSPLLLLSFLHQTASFIRLNDVHNFHSLCINLCAIIRTITDEDWGYTYDKDNIGNDVYFAH